MLNDNKYTPVLLKFSNETLKIYINEEIKIVPIKSIR